MSDSMDSIEGCDSNKRSIYKTIFFKLNIIEIIEIKICIKWWYKSQHLYGMLNMFNGQTNLKEKIQVGVLLFWK